MGRRRSYKKQQEKSFERSLLNNLWAIVGFTSMIIFFILLNRLGILLTFLLLFLLIGLILWFRYGQPTRLLHPSGSAPADQPSSGITHLTPAEVVYAQQSSSYTGTYYQPRGSGSQFAGQPQSNGQPKEEHPANFEQPQAQYPGQQPPPIW